jgi:malate synthase
VAVALRYFDSWLRGTGAAAIFDLMEDAATAEIARCQVWQWVHHRTPLSGGDVVTEDLVRSIVDEEEAGLRPAAARIFLDTALAEELPAFFTADAYAHYLV